MQEQDRRVWKMLKKTHVAGLPALLRMTGLPEEELLPILDRLMQGGRAFKKTRSSGRVVYSAYR